MTATSTKAGSLPAHDVTDLGLAAEGVRRIEWAEREMPVLRLIRERFERELPLEGLRIGACLHVTTETANLMRTLKAGGATVVLAASNPLSTKDDVAAALVDRVRDLHVRPSRRGPRHLLRHLNAVADTHPQITMDDGCDLVSLLHTERPRARSTRSSPAPRRRRPASSASRRWPPTARCGFPVVAVNEAQTKHLFDNRYGTGQSTVDGILRATNILLAGRNVVIAGYGWVGRGIASRMSGMGAHVAVIEVDPVARARGADGRLPGHDRRPRRRRGATCSSPPPATSTSSGASTSRRCATASIMANSGHFDAELDLRGAARDGRGPRPRGPRERPGVRPRRQASSTSSPRAGWSTWARPRGTRRRSWT